MTAKASKLQRTLQALEIWTNYRGDALRLGPAPYVVAGQFARAIEVIGDIVRT
jgi:kynureninase